MIDREMYPTGLLIFSDDRVKRAISKHAVIGIDLDYDVVRVSLLGSKTLKFHCGMLGPSRDDSDMLKELRYKIAETLYLIILDHMMKYETSEIEIKDMIRQKQLITKDCEHVFYITIE